MKQKKDQQNQQGRTAEGHFVWLLALSLVLLSVPAAAAAAPAAAADRLVMSDQNTPYLVDESQGWLRGFTKVAETVGPSVVNISTTSIVEAPQQAEVPEQFRRFFGDRFFREQPQGPQERKSLGSGVIVDPAGYILTNYHVVAPVENRSGREVATQIEVHLSDQRSYDAHVVGVDPASDLAVLKIGSENEAFPAAPVGNSELLEPGGWVVAIGSPFGLEQTVTTGIVSATERIVPTGIFGDYIQTDAAINPGNSGGPLVNLKGEVVGINSFITSTTGAYVGVGFAVPSSVFVNSYNQIIATGSVERGWLGISMNDYPMTDAMAEFFGVAGKDPAGIKDGDGVIITELLGPTGERSSEGPAAKAGIQEGDVVVRFDGKEVESLWQLRKLVGQTAPGQEVPVTVVRKGEVIELTVTPERRTLEEQQRADSEGYTFEEEEPEEPKEIGLEFRTLQSAEVERAGIEEASGVVVLRVAPGSLAAEAGLAPNQIITHVNGRAVESAGQFKQMITRLNAKEAAVLRVISVGPQGQARVGYTSLIKP